MNLQKRKDWINMRDELHVILMRVFSDYKIHAGGLPPDTPERKLYHSVGGSAMTHMAKIISMIRLTEAHAEIPSTASPEETLTEVRAEIAEISAEEKGDPGDEPDPAADAA